MVSPNATLKSRWLFLLIAATAALTMAQVSPYHQLRHDIQKIQTDRNALRNTMKQLAQDLQSKSARIQEHQRASTEYSLLTEYRRNLLLTDAKRLADRLDQLERQVHAMDRQLEEKAERIIANINATLEELSQKLRKTEPSDHERLRLRIIHLIQQRAYYRRFDDDTRPATLTKKGRLNPNDSRELVIAKRESLLDLKENIGRYIGRIDKQIRREARQLLIAHEVGVLLNEESFFGEDSIFDAQTASQRRLAAGQLAQRGDVDGPGDEGGERGEIESLPVGSFDDQHPPEKAMIDRYGMEHVDQRQLSLEPGLIEVTTSDLDDLSSLDIDSLKTLRKDLRAELKIIGHELERTQQRLGTLSTAPKRAARGAVR